MTRAAGAPPPGALLRPPFLPMLAGTAGVLRAHRGPCKTGRRVPVVPGTRRPTSTPGRRPGGPSSAAGGGSRHTAACRRGAGRLAPVQQAGRIRIYAWIRPARLCPMPPSPTLARRACRLRHAATERGGGQTVQHAAPILPTWRHRGLVAFPPGRNLRHVHVSEPHHPPCHHGAGTCQDASRATSAPDRTALFT